MSQVRRNGIALFYKEAGGGDLPLVFVHGWCCDHTYFAPQFEHFRRKHRVVTVDLRGHGQSDKPTQSYQERKERILDDISSAPQHVMVSTTEGLRDYDAATVAEGCVVPALYIAAIESQPRTDRGRFHELVPQLMGGKTVGSGHFCQLEVPEQVNTMIERFLTVALRDPSVAAS